jgi:hypothetical protein
MTLLRKPLGYGPLLHNQGVFLSACFRNGALPQESYDLIFQIATSRSPAPGAGDLLYTVTQAPKPQYMRTGLEMLPKFVP